MTKYIEKRRQIVKDVFHIDLDEVEDIDNSLDPEELAEMNQIPGCIIHYYSKYKVRWDLCIIFFAIYNSFMTPVAIAYEPAWSNEAWYTTVDLILNAFYIADIFVNLRTTYIDEGG